MRAVKLGFCIFIMMAIGAALMAQKPHNVPGADERYKVDILVVVAHPDDEIYFSPYILRAMQEEHKRVAVIYATRGDSGGNGEGRERGPALADARETEARDACARLGITKVWFLNAVDTAQQNPLVSLARWGHGENLERLVALVRLTRPEILLTHLPAVTIGEDHGDHSAAGVLATEAFDLAANPLAFPEQLSGEMHEYEAALSNLRPWQPSKLYFASDANDRHRFDGSGPEYSVRALSPAEKKPYWRLALESALMHRTQFPSEVKAALLMNYAEMEKFFTGPASEWWPEPLTLIFGKSVVGGSASEDVFAHVNGRSELAQDNHANPQPQSSGVHIELGGPWGFLAQFGRAHGLPDGLMPQSPEIAVKSGTRLVIPLVVKHDPGTNVTIHLAVSAPEGWIVKNGESDFPLPAAEAETTIALELETPAQPRPGIEELVLRGEIEGKPLGEVKMRIQVNSGALPQ